MKPTVGCAAIRQLLPVLRGSFWPFFTGRHYGLFWSGPVQMGGQIHAITHLMSIAREGYIYRSGAWVNAGGLAAEVSKSITWNAQVFEAWNYGFASKIHAICATLSSFDADILLTASGFDTQDLSELSRPSSEAVADAYRDLYGVEEDE